MAVRVPCRAKYRHGGIIRNGSYRARTGPRCCNDGCPSTKHKGNRFKGVRPGKSSMSYGQGR